MVITARYLDVALRRSATSRGTKHGMGKGTSATPVTMQAGNTAQDLQVVVTPEAAGAARYFRYAARRAESLRLCPF